MLFQSIEPGTRAIRGSATPTGDVRHAHGPDILKARERMLSAG
jgi:hypothetical protein